MHSMKNWYAVLISLIAINWSIYGMEVTSGASDMLIDQPHTHGTSTATMQKHSWQNLCDALWREVARQLFALDPVYAAELTASVQESTHEVWRFLRLNKYFNQFSYARKFRDFLSLCPASRGSRTAYALDRIMTNFWHMTSSDGKPRRILSHYADAQEEDCWQKCEKTERQQNPIESTAAAIVRLLQDKELRLSHKTTGMAVAMLVLDFAIICKVLDMLAYEEQERLIDVIKHDPEALEEELQHVLFSTQRQALIAQAKVATDDHKRHALISLDMAKVKLLKARDEQGLSALQRGRLLVLAERVYMGGPNWLDLKREAWEDSILSCMKFVIASVPLSQPAMIDKLLWQDENGQTGLNRGIRNHSATVDELRYYLAEAATIGKLPDVLCMQDDEGKTLLHVAVEHGESAILDVLLEAAQKAGKLADILFLQDKNECTALHTAVVVRRGMNDAKKPRCHGIVGKILEAAEKIGKLAPLLCATDNMKRTALFWAVQQRHRNNVQEMIAAAQKTAKLFDVLCEQDLRKETMLHYAAARRSTFTYMYIINDLVAAAKTLGNDQCEQLLSIANGNGETVRVLLEKLKYVEL